MYVNVNPASMARAIQGFVKAAGGEASYSSALELVARMSGFDAYRAQKAYAETNASKDDIVFETVLHAWDEGEEQGKPSQVERRKEAYRFQVEKFGDQLRLSIAPEDVKDLMASDGRNVLDVMLEINQGLPCLHMTNDPAGEMLLSVFGHAGGLLVREDEGKLEAARDANEKLAAHMRDEDWSTPGSRADDYVINRDTKELWADVETGTEADIPAAPVKPRYEVKASFEDYTAPDFGRLAFNFVLFDTVDPACPRDGWQVRTDSPFHTDTTEEVRICFCYALCRALSGLFNRKGSAKAQVDVDLLKSCLEGGVPLVQRLCEVDEEHPDVSFAELERLYRMTAAVWATVKNRK
jgi:hypothetical protein